MNRIFLLIIIIVLLYFLLTYKPLYNNTSVKEPFISDIKRYYGGKFRKLRLQKDKYKKLYLEKKRWIMKKIR